MARRLPRRPRRRKSKRRSSKLFSLILFTCRPRAGTFVFGGSSDSLPAPHRRWMTAGSGQVERGSADGERPRPSRRSRKALGLVNRLARDLAPPHDEPPVIKALDGAAQCRTLEPREHEIRGLVLRRVVRDALGLGDAEYLPRHPAIQLGPGLRYRGRKAPPVSLRDSEFLEPKPEGL